MDAMVHVRSPQSKDSDTCVTVTPETIKWFLSVEQEQLIVGWDA